jgi:DEAD/DEAH box helicase domain-containing protein
LTIQLEAQNVLLKPNDYGPNWAEQRDKARERDGYRCTHCNAPERLDRQHDVHHMTPFREFGYVPGRNDAYQKANQLENLQTLCRSCHQAVESARGTRSALSGMGHVVRNIATLLLMCSPNDIGVLVEQRSSHTKAPTITVYDHAAGGLGLSSKLYDLHEDLLTSSLELVRDCSCSEGCPACVGPVGEVGADTKYLTIALLEAMTNRLVR